MKNNKPYKASKEDIIRDSTVYSIPMDMVELIYSQEKVCHPFFGASYTDKFSYNEYQKMLMGASLAYRNQNLMGRIIPINSPKAMDIIRYLSLNNVAIQYHPQHGMILCDL